MQPQLSRVPRLGQLLAARAPLRVDDPARSPAAVAVVLVSTPDRILLIQRAERPGDPWSGQMAFPGGRWQPGDADLKATALRETREELALDLSEASYLGDLDDMAPTTPVLPPINVRPFVFALPTDPMGLIPNHEVARIAWPTIDQLLDARTYRAFRFERGEFRIERMGYHLAEGVVWGMSERILTPLLDLLK